MAVAQLLHRGDAEAIAALYLIGALLVSTVCELRLAVATSLASAIALLCIHSGQYESQAALVAGLFLAVALPTNYLANVARTHARDAAQWRQEARRIAAMFKTSPNEVSVLPLQHQALRRAATLVARGASPSKVFSTVAEEVACCLNVDTAAMFRYEADGTVVPLAVYTTERESTPGGGRRLIVEGDSIAAMVVRNGRPTGMDSHESAAGFVAAHLRKLGLRSPIVAPIIVENRGWGLLVVGSSREQRLPQNAESALRDFADLVATAIATAATREQLQGSRDSLGELATRQEALLRLAKLVARGVSPDECFASVATELARCLDVDKAELFRVEDDGAAIAVACHASPGTAHIPIGERVGAEDARVAVALLRTGHATTVDGNENAAGSVGARLRELGLGSVVAAPIVVDDRVWGMAVVGSTKAKSLPTDTTQRIAEFAELVATYIAASTTRAELIGSRVRIVAAADEARRRLERDLHDGAQQRLVALQLKLRTAIENMPDDPAVVRNGLAGALGRSDRSKELQQISPRYSSSCPVEGRTGHGTEDAGWPFCSPDNN